MCTVSFIPLSNSVIITSNRDEKTIRAIAEFPTQIKNNFSTIYYPKDAQAGGTWFISNNQGDVGVLLNGSEKNHISTPPYKQSRGLILVDIFKNENPLSALTHYDLTGIENFTLVLYINKNLFQARWNGNKLNIVLKDITKNQIWSSSTLYNQDMIQEREEWFFSWLEKNNAENILQFHLEEKKENTEYGIFMNRNNVLQTVSISSIQIENHQSKFYYKDCISNKESELIINRDYKSIQNH